MALLDPLRHLQDTKVAEWVQTSNSGFPLLDALHVISVMLVFGSIAMLDLRLLGLVGKSKAVTRISDEVLPWTWVAFVVSVITGCLLFTAQAESYLNNHEFKMKMLLMLLAGINLGVFHFFTWNSVRRWDNGVPTPSRAKIAALLSLCLWSGVVIFGRWIGWTVGAI